MGYRSEVVLAIAPEAAPAFMAMCAKYPEVNNLCFRDSDYKVSGYERDGDWFFRWDCLKWYDSFPEIAEINNFMQAMIDDDLSQYGEKEQPKNDSSYTHWDLYFKFVRLGEDTDDCEMFGCGFDHVYIERGISY